MYILLNVWLHYEQIIADNHLAAMAIGEIALEDTYNPLIDDEVAETFKIDKNYKLIGQLVFGNPTGETGEKNRPEPASRVTILE